MKRIIFLLCLLSIGSGSLSAQTGLQGDGWFNMPLRSTNNVLKGEWIYFVGGYNSEDSGTLPWGSNDETVNLFLGDQAGEIEIAYTDGAVNKIPLIFGYTMWFRAHWMDGGAPFKTEEAEPEMTACLQKTLHLQGGFEGKEQVVLKVKIEKKPIREIRLIDNPKRRGIPVFAGGYLLSSDVKKELQGGIPVHTDDPFFDTHTVNSRKPNTMQANLKRMMKRLYTFEEDFNRVPWFIYPNGYKGAKISFTGNSYATLLTRIYHDNLADIVANKMQPDGMLNESSFNAPSWRYDGFGTWVPKANSYYGCMYSRDRALGILSYLDLLKESQQTVDFLNRWMMYYPDNNLTILGKRVPGHWSVIPNKPMEYSKVLTVVANWPTRYTKERFGEDYQNFGNSEPDGHGWTMMSIANVWLNSGASAQWVLDNWTYVNEAVHYIDWAMKNPDISFNERGLMYGETEGGMMEFTLFNNMPCYLGVRMYTEMARKAGKTKEAETWKELADSMEQAILKEFSADGKWKSKQFGFFHDPALTNFADYVGYDVANDAPAQWYQLSKNTYQDDIDRYIGDTYVGPRGLGYDHNIITQNALLLDQTEDYDQFVTNLTKLCYSPRLPNPCIVPEGASYSREKGMYRRQGDLGNFVQQNETLRTILLIAGTSKVQGGTIKLMPRLPKAWSVDVSDLTINGSDAKISYRVSHPEKNVQVASFVVTNKGDLNRLKFRAGPFTKEQVTINGETVDTEAVGDARWLWITIEKLQDNKEYAFEIQ